MNQSKTILDHSGWCPDNAVCMDWIDRRALECLENFIEADSVYMSNDIYTEFMKQMAQITQYGRPHTNTVMNVFCINTSVGKLTVKRTALLSNFCYVGTETSGERLVWEKVSQDFEKAFFGEDL